MKEIKQYVQKIEEVSKYIAFDGAEFNEHYLCASYEQDRYKDMLQNSPEDIFKRDTTIAPFDSNDVINPDSKFEWFKINTQLGLEILKGAFRLDECELPDVGETVCIETTGYGRHYCHRLKNHIQSFGNFLSKVATEYSLVLTYALDDFIFNSQNGCHELEEDVEAARELSELLKG